MNQSAHIVGERSQGCRCAALVTGTAARILGLRFVEHLEHEHVWIIGVTRYYVLHPLAIWHQVTGGDLGLVAALIPRQPLIPVGAVAVAPLVSEGDDHPDAVSRRH